MTSAFETFRDLHAGPELLILPNAWDAGSARLMEQAGARAIATTSAGVAWAHGYKDGNALPIELLEATVRESARVVSVPITADSEGGYSDDPATAAANILRLLRAGAVGINLEDGAGAPELLCAKIGAIKQAAAAAGMQVFVNARIDVVLFRLVPPEQAVEETIRRIGLYAAAGCDGVFTPGVTEPEQIAAICRSTPLPVNLLTRPTLPDAAELTRLGVRRLSAGSTLATLAYARAVELAKGFLDDGKGAPLTETGLTYGALNGAFPAT